MDNPKQDCDYVYITEKASKSELESKLNKAKPFYKTWSFWLIIFTKALDYEVNLQAYS